MNTSILQEIIPHYEEISSQSRFKLYSYDVRVIHNLLQKRRYQYLTTTRSKLNNQYNYINHDDNSLFVITEDSIGLSLVFNYQISIDGRRINCVKNWKRYTRPTGRRPRTKTKTGRPKWKKFINNVLAKSRPVRNSIVIHEIMNS